SGDPGGRPGRLARRVEARDFVARGSRRGERRGSRPAPSGATCASSAGTGGPSRSLTTSSTSSTRSSRGRTRTRRRTAGTERRGRDLGSPSVGEFAVRDFRHDLRDLREQRGDGRTFPVANDFIHVLDEVLAGTHANETAGGGDERLRRDLESPSVGAFPDQRELRIREQAKREFPYSKDFLKSPAITTTTTVPNIPLTSTVGTVTEQAIGGAAGADETTASVEKKKKKKKKGMEDADLEKQGDKKNARKMEVTDATRRRRRLGRRDNRAAIQDILKLSVG
ncbi:hypothetical protein THAOC_08304, partial [Thalassiosira oceanica]